MGQHRGETDEAGGLVDRGGLDGRDLMLAQGLAHDVEPARQRGIAKGLFRSARPVRMDGRRPATSPG